MDKTEEINLLLSTTITFLKFFIEQYEANKIDRVLFIQHTEIKIGFVKDNFNMMSLNDEKNEAVRILNKCNEIYGEV